MRTRVGVGLGLIAIALVGILWSHHGRDDGDAAAPGASSAVSPSSASDRSAPQAAARLAPGAQPSLAAAPAQDDHPQAVPVPDDPSLAPPPLDGPHSEPAAPQKPFTHDEQVQQRVADLALLDETEKRLSGELDAAQKRGDTEGARLLQVRLTRVRALRETRRTELDQLRHGGTVPQ